VLDALHWPAVEKPIDLWLKSPSPFSRLNACEKPFFSNLLV
jgi:hypothetical protein